MNKNDILEFLQVLERRGFLFCRDGSEYEPIMVWEHYKQYKAVDDHLARAEIFQRLTRPDND